MEHIIGTSEANDESNIEKDKMLNDKAKATLTEVKVPTQASEGPLTRSHGRRRLIKSA